MIATTTNIEAEFGEESIRSAAMERLIGRR